MDLAEKIAVHYGVETVDVLTEFKLTGEISGGWKSGAEGDYNCGFEESYGYLTGSHFRDEDAVNTTFMICEMFACYIMRGVSLIQKLEGIYSTYGYCVNTLHANEFPGSV